MKTIQFVFGLHDHQPVGNFPAVFREAYERAYEPFLKLLEKHAHFRVVLHHTGPLLQWIEANEPGYLKRLKKLVKSGQVELLGGAFYEPILPIIPEEDRVGQIVEMSDWLERVFGVRPRGMWLAERVWEPTLPKSIRQAGLEYTVLDDSHFKSVGIDDDGCIGYYLTEEQGHTIAVFPINEKLRHAIPYATPEAAIEYLESMASEDSARTLIMADDGEKFGVWPDSFRHCYEDEWMERFAARIAKEGGWIFMKTFSEVLDETQSVGRVYLPAASYLEMMQWALPANALVEYEQILEKMKSRGEYDRGKIFVRGGFWRSFFSKYDESNHIHKRMLAVSRKIHAAPEGVRSAPEYARAKDHLWQSQCNCAYWHGVFGGLYLTNLRNALYSHLIAADALIDQLTHGDGPWSEFSVYDFDIDGGVELIAESPAQMLMVKPHAGGMIVEHDIRAARFNVLDTLMRRREFYHEHIAEGGNGGGDVRVKEANLERVLAVDWHRRGSLIDHFLGEGTTPEDFRQVRYSETGDFVDAGYECSWESVKDGAKITLQREGLAESRRGGVRAVRIEKTIHAFAMRPECVITYRVRNLSQAPLEARFGVEFNVNLLAGDAPDRYHIIEGTELGDANKMISTGMVRDVSRFAVVDQWGGIRVDWELSRWAEHWRLPIETASSSVEGIERVY
ncbi:DUF1926 domain-containing protein, partial [Candidatus Poribacteria bacterium]|nr:DUF1926 domain-containing protein [Candidatus Poribacteria bacterium]